MITDPLYHIVHANLMELAQFLVALIASGYARFVRSFALNNRRWQEQEGVNGGLGIQARAAVERTTLQYYSQLALLLGGFMSLVMEPGVHEPLANQASVFRVCAIASSLISIRKSYGEQETRRTTREYYARRDKRSTDVKVEALHTLRETKQHER